MHGLILRSAAVVTAFVIAGVWSDRFLSWPSWVDPILAARLHSAELRRGASVFAEATTRPRHSSLVATNGGGPEPSAEAAADGAPGVRDPAWSPDGKRIAASVLDQIHVMTPSGRGQGPVATWSGPPAIERDPAWAPNNTRIAFAADRGDGFDLYVVDASGGSPSRITALAGDERWPTWTADGRLVFACRNAVQWDLYLVDVRNLQAGAPPEPTRLTSTVSNETEPRVSPDGQRLVFVSDEANDDGDVDLWVMPLAGVLKTPTSSEGELKDLPRRVLRTPGTESSPAWSPASDRLVYRAVREGIGSLWTISVDRRPDGDGRVARERPGAPPQLISRQGGAPAWSPDGQTILVAEIPDGDPVYNGDPLRSRSEPPPLFGFGGAYRLRLLPAPRPVDAGTRGIELTTTIPQDRWLLAFDRVWSTLRELYYASGPSATEWVRMRDEFRPRAVAAADEGALETIVDEMVARQPLIKPAVSSRGAVVVSGHRLASEAGVRALEAGGNIVDAAIAVSFALGVVEPEASGLGGDGMALLFLNGMTEPTVIDYKDQTPIRATLDNPRIFPDGRLVADGPAAANIPGVVAGMDYLYSRYGSKAVSWEALIDPAVTLAEEGYILDETLPTSVAEGRGYFQKYPASSRIYLPGGEPPVKGERFVNQDYASTLRTIAKEGGSTFYRGTIARKIASDMAANGGVIGYDDLAQYRAIERKPVKGAFRGHLVFGPPPPVGSGVSLIETLQILDRYHSPSTSPHYASDPDYLHYAIESWKARDQVRIADPERWAVDLGQHLESSHAEELFKRIDPTRASRYREDPALETNESGGGATNRIGRGTTAFVVADTSGNMIALTQTLSTWGGTFYVSDGLGFLYNNHLRSNRTVAGQVGQLLPLVRSSSTSNPTLVFRRDGEKTLPRLAVGAAGNAWITASVYDIILNVIDGGLSMQAAIEAPRFLIGRDPTDPIGTRARIQIEDRFPRRLLESLLAKGHVFQKIGRKGEVRYGYSSAVLVDDQTGVVFGGAEPRRSHAAVPWEGRPRTTGGVARR